MDDEGGMTVLAGIALIVFVLVLSVMLFGCAARQQSSTTEVETEADIYWCVGACGGARTQHEVDSTKTVIQDAND